MCPDPALVTPDISPETKTDLKSSFNRRLIDCVSSETDWALFEGVLGDNDGTDLLRWIDHQIVPYLPA